jgi:predicted dehydrogenase
VTIRIGFVGAGLIAFYHGLMLQNCDEPHVVTAVHDLDHDRASGFATWKECAVAGSLDELLDSCDALFVCTWTAAHRDAVMAAVSRRMPVFCEKPLAKDLRGADELCAEVGEAGIVNMVGLVLRSQAPLLAMRSLIHDERSGRIMNVVFRDDQYIPTQGMYASTWRGDPDKAGSGTMLEHSIHDVDLLEWLCGPVTTVSARTANFHGIDHIEDSVAATFGFAGGHSATLTSVWHDVMRRPSQRRMEIFCERALLTLEGEIHGPVHWERDDDAGSIRDDELTSWLAERGIVAEIAENAFLRAVREGSVASPGFAEARRAHVLVDAVYRSARQDGAPIDVTA